MGMREWVQYQTSGLWVIAQTSNDIQRRVAVKYGNNETFQLKTAQWYNNEEECAQKKHLPQPLQRPCLRRLSVRNPHKVLCLHPASSPPLLAPPPPTGPRAPPVGKVRVHLLRRRTAHHFHLLIFTRRCRLHHNVVVPDEIHAHRHFPDDRHRVAGLVDGERHEGGLGDADAAVRGGGEERRRERGARGPLERGEGRGGVAGAGGDASILMS